jgi:cytosine deaminase
MSGVYRKIYVHQEGALTWCYIIKYVYIIRDIFWVGVIGSIDGIYYRLSCPGGFFNITTDGKMNDSSNYIMRTFGFSLLESMTVNPSIKAIYQDLKDYTFNNSFTHDREIWLTCVLALQSITLGNFGIGSIITDNNNNVVSYGNNQVFYPLFRSDFHAEMVALNHFESVVRPETVGGYKLFTSLEPCPMCLARILTAGIPEVYYAADDIEGGMAHLKEAMPKVWVEMMKDRHIAEADCSQKLIAISERLVGMNRDALDEKLKKRGVG